MLQSDIMHNSDEPSSPERIIAFDTECTVNFFPHIELAVFAYAEADGDFNIIGEDDIYIHASKPDRRLAHKIQVDMDRLKRAPDYTKVYPRISGILGREDAILLAHGGRSDIEFMATTNDMRRLPHFDFALYDTERIVRNYCEMPAYRLEALCEEWGIEHNPHDAGSDAAACIRIMEHIARAEGISMGEIIGRYGEGARIESHWINDDTVFRRRKAKMEREVRNLMKTDRDGELNGVTICLSETFMEDYPEAAFAIIRSAVRRGADYTDAASRADLFVHDGNPCSGEIAAASARRCKKRKAIRVDRFLDGRYGRFPKECHRYMIWGSEGFSDRFISLKEVCFAGMSRKRIERYLMQNTESFSDVGRDGRCSGHRFCFSESFVNEHADCAKHLVLKIIEEGGRYESDVSECTVFVYDNNYWSSRLDHVRTDPDIRCKTITFDELIDGRYGEFPVECKSFVLKPFEKYDACESRRRTAEHFASKHGLTLQRDRGSGDE